MFRRSASSLLLAGLLFADGSWLARLEGLFAGLLGFGAGTDSVWATSECGASIDPNGRPQTANSEFPPRGGSSTAERGGSIDPNG